jgi:hypothetical protein
LTLGKRRALDFHYLSSHSFIEEVCSVRSSV